MGTSGAAAIDVGDLQLSGGLLALLRPALDRLEPGGVLAVLSSSPQTAEDLPSWCRLERHLYLGAEPAAAGRTRHLIQRGTSGVPRGAREEGMQLPLRPLHAGAERHSRIISADLVERVPMPPTADPGTGFGPRGARVEPGGPSYPFDLLERDRFVPPEIGQLYDQGVAGQWDASRDIPWDRIGRLPPALEAAICQIMTFLAENELSALYVPSRFLPRIHPAYAEVAMVLAQQLADEARHIDGFLKRARAGGGGAGISTAATSASLRSLLDPDDFTEATFLLSVLGEGTFLDLLRFIETYAPDEATAELCRRARIDESRHVHFGLAHVRHALAHDPGLFARLEAAVRRRAATLAGTQVPGPVQDALTVLAAGGTEPAAISRGHDAWVALLETMAANRISRLESAGFDSEQAEILSELHTPNFM